MGPLTASSTDHYSIPAERVTKGSHLKPVIPKIQHELRNHS